jgi:hypothetical protein
MRLVSGADDSLPFHPDAKKLVECELHSPTHSVLKEDFCQLNAIQIVYFDSKEQNESAMHQLLQRTATKQVTCNSETSSRSLKGYRSNNTFRSKTFSDRFLCTWHLWQQL